MTRPIAAVLAAAALLAGCGGGSDQPKTVTKDLYISEGDSVCSDMRDSFTGAGAANPQTPKEIAEAADVLATVYDDLLTRLQKVKLPTRAADRRGAVAYIAAVRRTRAPLDDLRASAEKLQKVADAKDRNAVAQTGTAVRSALDDFRAAQAQANQRALAYGFQLCGNLN